MSSENGGNEEGKICTQCGKWKCLSEFHKKADRRASRCAKCIIKEKRLYRKAKRKKKNRLITQASLLKREIVGNLTDDTIQRFSSTFADFLMGT